MKPLARLACAALLSGACRAEPPVEVRTAVRVAGTPLVQALVREYRRVIPNTTVATVLSSPIAVTDAFERGEADVGVTFADAAYSAYIAGKRLRAIATLHVAPLLLIARADSGISSVTDLPAHAVRLTGTGGPDPRFGPGWTVPPGLSPLRLAGDLRVTGISQLVLLAFGVKPDSVRNKPFGQHPEVLRELRAGTIDAAFLVVYDTGDLLSETTRNAIRFVPIEGPAVDRLRTEYAFIRPVSVPEGTFAGQTGALHTVGIDLVLVCREDLNEQAVYDITRAHLTTFPRLATAVATQPAPDLEKALATPIPLHDGAARYYREWELSR